MNTIECIKSRASVRDFKPDDVPDETIDDIISAAARAPSAGNVQDWEFIVVRKKEAKGRLSEAAFEQNFVSKAPVVIVVCSNIRAIGSAYGERGSTLYSVQDAAAATENMMLTAWEKGIGSCWVGSFSERTVKEILVLPEHVRPLAIVPLGYPASEPSPSERKDPKTFVHREFY